MKTITLFWTVALMLWVSEAFACPQCAQNESNSGISPILLWGMILLPMVIAAITYPILKKLCRPDDGINSPVQDGAQS